MNKKILISIILIIMIVIGALIAIKIAKPQEKEETQKEISKNREELENKISEENTESNTDNTQVIENIKNETGITASEEIYEVQEEYDGREILVIKPDIQFKTVLSGILKNAQPSEQDIEQLDLSKFHKGVWISEVSRDRFLQILKKCNIENFDIDSEGYLYKKSNSQNEYSLKLENLINSEELTIIDITGVCYIRDEVTGDIVEYPFKDMDLYQTCERYETQGSKIIVVTTNDIKEINILQEICN